MMFTAKDGPWRCLPGWFNYMDLYEKAVELSADGDTLVEIGSAFGRSLSYLAQCARESKKSLHIVAIDPFMPNLDVWGAEFADWAQIVGGPRAAFDLGISRHDPELWEEINDGRVRVIQDFNENVVSQFTDASCSFVFIDGDHRYDAVKRDCENWEPKVRDAGILAGHDFTPNDACGVDVVRYVSKKYPAAELWNTSWVHHIVRPKERITEDILLRADDGLAERLFRQANMGGQIGVGLGLRNERLP
jgi:predicted O-methyltransferase YrrM